MSYHPQMDGHTERTNQIIEDMLRMYVRTKPNKWEDYLHLVEFAYNNGYQTSAKLSPFEILYMAESVRLQLAGITRLTDSWLDQRCSKKWRTW
jgi:hypothetical protein